MVAFLTIMALLVIVVATDSDPRDSEAAPPAPRRGPLAGIDIAPTRRPAPVQIVFSFHGWLISAHRRLGRSLRRSAQKKSPLTPAQS